DARMDHRVGQPRGFVGVHPAKQDRHQQRGSLVVRQRAARHSGNEVADFVARQRPAIPLAHDDVYGSHEGRGSILRRSMSQVSQLSPELARGLLQLARAVLAATRNWTLYPPEHPAVGQSVERLADALEELVGGSAQQMVAIGITPDTLIVEG